jgi:predicted RNase H-like HicB family nuclease
LVAARKVQIAATVKMKRMNLTAVYVKVEEGYIGFVEEIPGVNTQGKTLEETRANLQEAAGLVLRANRALAEESLLGQHAIREPFVVAAA